jgi:hypothetical protein
MVIKINSIVNEKYCCYIDDKGNYTYEVKKLRKVQEQTPVKPMDIPKEPIKEKVPIREQEVTLTDDFVTADTIPESFVDDSVRNECIMIKEMLEKEGKPVTKFSMRLKVVQLIEDEILPPENKPSLCDYINKHCPEGLD